MKSTILGWSFEQWANATKMMCASPTSLKEAVELRHRYISKYKYEPSINKLIIDTDGNDIRCMDYEAAALIFSICPR